MYEEFYVLQKYTSLFGRWQLDSYNIGRCPELHGQFVREFADVSCAFKIKCIVSRR